MSNCLLVTKAFNMVKGAAFLNNAEVLVVSTDPVRNADNETITFEVVSHDYYMGDLYFEARTGTQTITLDYNDNLTVVGLVACPDDPGDYDLGTSFGQKVDVTQPVRKTYKPRRIN